jgi:leucine dehydrogenase
MTIHASPASPAGVFDHPEFRGHEQILFGHDAASGLSTIIALHDTRLGPAAGGCRMWPYASSYEALTDALRLSRGMTYKNALAGLDLGGGKSVIIADPNKDKTPALLRAFGHQVESLHGRYITAEDVGITSDDMEIVSQVSRHALGTKATGLGDPSPYTAIGVFVGLKAAVGYRRGDDDLNGLVVSVQGLGNVGYGVAKLLHHAGAKLIVSDINKAVVDHAVAEFGATAVDARIAHKVAADVFCPCALGAGLNAATIPQIRAGIVAGAANNQLATEADGMALREADILYAPDYAINAGGVISIALGKPGEGDDKVRQQVVAIGDTLTAIFRRADAEGRSTQSVADAMAEERLSRTARAA